MKHVKQLLSALLVLAVVLSLLPAGVLKASAAEAPAALDIGYPTFKNTELLDEVYDLSKLGVSYSEKDIMMAIYKQDLANGGDSFYRTVSSPVRASATATPVRTATPTETPS